MGFSGGNGAAQAAQSSQQAQEQQEEAELAKLRAEKEAKDKLLQGQEITSIKEAGGGFGGSPGIGSPSSLGGNNGPGFKFPGFGNLLGFKGKSIGARIRSLANFKGN